MKTRFPIVAGSAYLAALLYFCISPVRAQGPAPTYNAGGPKGPPAPWIDAVQSPLRIVAGPDGRLWLTDYARRKVLIIEPATLSVLEEFGVIGAPTGLAIMGDRVYVGNETDGRIDVYDADGYFQFAFDTPVIKPNDLAASATHGLLFAVSSVERQVFVFDARGRLIRAFPESIDGQSSLGMPSCVDLFEPPLRQDINGDAIVDVSDLLDLLAAWGTAGGVADLDDDGIVGMTDVLDLLANWDRTPPTPEVLVSDFGDPSAQVPLEPGIRVYDVSGTHLRTLSGTGRFTRPQGMAATRDGRVFVADSLLSRVMVLDRTTGASLGSLGRFGTTEGTLNMPLDLHLDVGTGDIVVTSNRDGRIVTFRNGGVQP